MVKRIDTASSQSKTRTNTESLEALCRAFSVSVASESPRFAVLFAMVFPKEPKGMTPYYINVVEPVSGGVWTQKLNNVFEIQSKSSIN